MCLRSTGCNSDGTVSVAFHVGKGLLYILVTTDFGLQSMLLLVAIEEKHAEFHAQLTSCTQTHSVHQCIMKCNFGKAGSDGYIGIVKKRAS